MDKQRCANCDAFFAEPQHAARHLHRDLVAQHFIPNPENLPEGNCRGVAMSDDDKPRKIGPQYRTGPAGGTYLDDNGMAIAAQLWRSSLYSSGLFCGNC